MNERSSRSHAVVTLHLDSWAQPGSQEDQDAAHGEQLLSLLQRARALVTAADAAACQGEADSAADTQTGKSDTDEQKSEGHDATAQDHGSESNDRVKGRGALGEPAEGSAVEQGNVCHGRQGVFTTASDAVICTAYSSARSLTRVCGCWCKSLCVALAGGDGADIMPAADAPPAPDQPSCASGVRRMRKFGKLVLVDLAGSERLKASGNEGQGAAETGAINKSLFTLGQVLHALSLRKASNTPHSVRSSFYRKVHVREILRACRPVQFRLLLALT